MIESKMVLKINKIDYKRATAKLRRILDESIKAGNLTSEDLKELGKSKAKSIAPVYSGQTRSKIKARASKGKDGVSWLIYATNILNDNHIRNIENFDLTRWMHTSPRAQGHIKRGNRQFLYETTRYLNKIKKNVAKGHFNNIKIK